MTFAFVTHGEWLSADVKDNIAIHQEGGGGGGGGGNNILQ